MTNNGEITDLPAISDATFPSAVVVVVAAKRTPFRAFLKKSLGLTLIERLPSAFLIVSDRPGMSRELRYKIVSVRTENFWAAIRSEMVMG